MILATFNGLDLLLIGLVIAAAFWLAMRGAYRLDEFEDRLNREWRDERIRRQLDEPVCVLYDQEADWDETLDDIRDLPEAAA